MQHSLLHDEYARAVVHARVRAAAERHPRGADALPARSRVARRRAADALARLAWRLDREAALRVWP